MDTQTLFNNKNFHALTMSIQKRKYRVYYFKINMDYYV